jgi:hypothetical protein
MLEILTAEQQRTKGSQQRHPQNDFVKNPSGTRPKYNECLLLHSKKHPMSETPEKSKLKSWLKRVGFAGFLFFLIKGLVWIVIFIVTAKGCGMGK